MFRLAVLLLLLTAPGARAETITIKLATLAPQGSSWERALRDLGSRWEAQSRGVVTLRIYAGGVAGNEGAMLRKLRIGQLQAASVTSVGLHDIDPAAQVLQTPLLIRTDGELDHVMRELGPEFERRFAERGFVVLGWTDVGWVRLFTARALLEPREAHRHRTWVWSGDPTAAALFKAAGFRPVITDSTDVLPSLQSGLIDAFPSAPLAALGMQWLALAPHMLDVPWAPLLAAMVIDGGTWSRIPAELRPALHATALEIAASIRGQVREQERKAIAVMRQYGLQVAALDAAQRARWEALGPVVHPVMRGAVPPEIFERVQAALRQYRDGAP